MRKLVRGNLQEKIPQLYMDKGYSKGFGKGPKGKGKGKKSKPGKGGFRNQPHRHVAPQLNFDGSKRKGKGKPYPKGKRKSFQYGNREKGELRRVNLVLPRTHPSHVDFATRLATPLTVVEDALHNNTLYQQTRSKFSPRQQLLFADLENSLFSHNTCSWCLQSNCDGRSSCSAPEEPLFFTQTNDAFCEEILPLVKNAKLELPVDFSDPQSPQQFNFQDSHWGGDDPGYPYAHQYSNERSTYIYDINNDDGYNQYHYPQQKYAGCWPNYNYEADMQGSSQLEPSQYGENETSYEANNADSLIEEDDDSVVYDDGFSQ
jgi:hypothetical protein